MERLSEFLFVVGYLAAVLFFAALGTLAGIGIYAIFYLMDGK